MFYRAKGGLECDQRRHSFGLIFLIKTKILILLTNFSEKKLENIEHLNQSFLVNFDTFVGVSEKSWRQLKSLHSCQTSLNWFVLLQRFMFLAFPILRLEGNSKSTAPHGEKNSVSL